MLILKNVCQILDMAPRHIPFSQRRYDLGDVRQTLANVVVVLQQQAKASSSKLTPIEKHQIVKQFNKLKPSAFKGGPNPIEAKQWTMEIEKIFQVMDCEEQHRVRLATVMFKGEAEYCWKIKKRCLCQTEDPIT